jgi:hypothetical protein
MKKLFAVFIFLSAVLFLSCTSQKTTTAHAKDDYSEDSITIDAAIKKIALYYSNNLASKTNVALISFETDNKTLSDYIFEEFWIFLEDNSSLVLVDRKNLELINKEMSYQLSGMVSDDSAKAIGHQFGTQTLIYGKLIQIGKEYRLSVYATDVERATSSVRVADIKPDKRLAALLEKPAAENAGINMANILYAGFDNPFQFTVQTDKSNGIYHDGEYMKMRIFFAKDAYFKVTHIDVNGNAQVIYPTTSRDNNYIKAGQTRDIPDNTKFKMTKPYGEEIILVAAYDAPFAVSRQTAPVPVSNNVITRGLVVESTETKTNIEPIATAKFTFSIRQ